MQDDEPSRTEDMVGNLNNLEVCKCIRGKRCINREYIQCMSWHDGDATRAAAAVSTRTDSAGLKQGAHKDSAPQHVCDGYHVSCLC